MIHFLAGIALAASFQCETPLSYGDIPIVLITPKNKAMLSGTSAEIVFGSVMGGSAQELPWRWIVDVELIPETGSVYVLHPADVHRASTPISVEGINNPITWLATISVRNLQPGESYRIMLTEIDPANPPGCPVTTFKEVLGEFSLAAQ